MIIIYYRYNDEYHDHCHHDHHHHDRHDIMLIMTIRMIIVCTGEEVSTVHAQLSL